jgi:hypothetical protein
MNFPAFVVFAPMALVPRSPYGVFESYDGDSGRVGTWDRRDRMLEQERAEAFLRKHVGL